ncbi:MAG: hypothetical protein EKK52_04875 [Burkholderiales bacterium]|uniref:hypothetical protein n=1 Tax=Roseateles sp. TaxID=1971397 RepID=UPI000FAB546C|nr:MAG: hypothetical protein EKK52_04875 [Burkholderiales bacterium]
MTQPNAPKKKSRAKANAPRQPPATAPAKSKGWTLETPPDAPGQTHDQLMAKVASVGVVGNARSLVMFGEATFGELSLTDCAKVLTATAQGFNDGDLSAAVTMLSSQAVALNAMFGELARRSALNMGEYIDASERYMRLALKVQGQCRATLEALAAIKNPPVVFARQANINNGGQQQVNNGAVLPTNAEATHAEKTVSEPNELLEDLTDGRTQLDTRATTTTGRANPGLEPLGAVNRPAKP